MVIVNIVIKIDFFDKVSFQFVFILHFEIGNELETNSSSYLSGKLRLKI